MLCLNCGKRVPFVGDVCPWCRTPKQQSQRTSIFYYIYGSIGGAIGYCIGDSVGGEGTAIYGVIIGIIIGGVVGIVQGMQAGKGSSLTQVNCPQCKTLLTVDRNQGPNYNCPSCGFLFHLL
jgi:uncharacterized protein YbaR (Trm112 family)